MDTEQFIERRIITGLIVSDDYIRKISEVWDARFIVSNTARILSKWCFDYYKKYQKAPNRDIEGIFTAQIKSLHPDQIEDIQQILSSLSEEYARTDFNFQYLLDQTYSYFREQNLQQFAENIKGQLASGQYSKAERIASHYQPIKPNQINSIDPFASADKIKEAFKEQQKPLIKFGKSLGKLLNSQMTRDAFVAFLGREKIGKTWFLMEIAMRANRSGCNVAFFQAGDMTENQYILRQCIYLTNKPQKEKYCTGIWIPVLDCKYNQLGTCHRPERENVINAFENNNIEINYDILIKAYENTPNYKPCTNCDNLCGTPWLVPRPTVSPLTWEEAYKAATKWKERYKKQFRLSTYANETLSVSEINTMLDLWEKNEQFVPDVIVIDYADLLTSDLDIRNFDFRNKQNIIWQRLRALSQQRHCLVITATQAAASSYGKKLITMNDFSEDKRKYAHVTAFYGLNQTDEEKQIGIMRVNPIVVREDDYQSTKPVHILQRLQIGKPILTSYI